MQTSWNSICLTAETLPIGLIKLRTPALSDITRGQQGDNRLSVWMLKALFYRVTKFYGVEWDESVLIDAAILGYKEYHYLSLAEWKLFEEKIKAGHFGKQFHKLSPAEMLGHLGTFALSCEDARAGQDRVQTAQQIQQQQAERPAGKWVLKYCPFLRIPYWAERYVSDAKMQALRRQLRQNALAMKEGRDAEFAERQRRKTAERRAQSEAAMRQWCKDRGLNYEDWKAQMDAEEKSIRQEARQPHQTNS